MENKLNRIKEKCREIIALGKNRTHGKWGSEERVVYDDEGVIARLSIGITASDTANAAFIAAVAGPAEALARSTLVAIEWFSEQKNEEALNDILAAWPDELL